MLVALPTSMTLISSYDAYPCSVNSALSYTSISAIIDEVPFVKITEYTSRITPFPSAETNEPMLSFIALNTIFGSKELITSLLHYVGNIGFLFELVLGMAILIWFCFSSVAFSNISAIAAATKLSLLSIDS